jgi:4-hydroxy-tetrahydrodipicolinate synthase
MNNGFYPALGTPTDENGKLMESSYARGIELMIGSGAAGMLCMGSMGKMESIRNSEYPKIAAQCVNVVSKRVPVMVGVMDCSVSRVLDRIDALGNIAINGVVATAPFYSRASAGGIVNFFAQIAKKSKYPVFIYDLPSVTQSPVTADILKQLMGIQNIKGMKTGNMNLILYLMRKGEIRPDFSVFYSGLDAFDAALLSGMKRNLDGMFTCTPRNSRMMYEDSENLNIEKIAEHLNNILVLRDLFVKEDVLAAYSYAMELLGCPGNYHSDYATPVSELLKQDIHNCMKRIHEI